MKNRQPFVLVSAFLVLMFAVVFSQTVQAAIYSSLTVGSRGAQVTELQQTLTNLGFYSGPITGYFGGITRAAVVKFQIANNVVPAVGYFGSLSRAKLNQLAQSKPTIQPPTPLPPIIPPTPLPNPKEKNNSSENPQFAILEDDGSLTSIDQHGTKVLNLQAISNLFYKNHSDNYDFLGIYSDFPSTLGGSTLISNTETGIGVNTLNDTSIYGSQGKLKTISRLSLPPFSSTIDENKLWQDFFLLAHELGHHWCCWVTTNPQIAGQGGHWLVSYGHPHDPQIETQQLDAHGLDIMGGADFINNQDGTFTMRDYSGIGPRVTNFFPLTLYLMGLISPNEVPDSLFLKFQTPLNTIGVVTPAEKTAVSIGNVIALNGSRNPTYPNTQKDFSVALILVVEKWGQPNPESVTRMGNLVENFPWYWTRATHCRSTMSTDLAETNAKKCQPVSTDRTVVTTSPSNVTADGFSQSKITIIAKDAGGNLLKDRVVEIFPDNIDKALIQGQADAIRPPGFTSGSPFGGLDFAVTDSDGRVIFTTTSKVATTFTYFVVIDGSYLNIKPTIKFTSP